MNRFFLISGCSGGGKSTLLAELAKRGHAVVEEPGRRIVAEERTGRGSALPWIDPVAFCRRAIEMARADLSLACRGSGHVFFDRGLVDAAVALQFASGTPYRETLGDERHYARAVFFAPPWPRIFAPDEDRRHDFEAALEECDRLRFAFADLGYSLRVLPKLPAAARADFVLANLM